MPFEDDVTPGHSTVLEYSTTESNYADEEAGTDSFTEIDNIEEITPGEVDVSDIETSHMKTAEQWKTYMAGWKEPGEATASVQYNKTQYAALNGLIGTNKGWHIVLQDGSTVKFDGYIKKLGMPVDREGKTLNAITIKLSGKPVFEAAA